MTEARSLLVGAIASLTKVPLILVDGSNVAHGGERTPLIDNLDVVLSTLATHPLRVLTMIDASLRHRIDRPQELETRIEFGRVVQAPAGRAVDDFLMQLARKKQSEGECVYILTNDRFPEKDGGRTVQRIAFLIVTIDEHKEVLFSPSIESLSAHTTESGK